MVPSGRWCARGLCQIDLSLKRLASTSLTLDSLDTSVCISRHIPLPPYSWYKSYVVRTCMPTFLKWVYVWARPMLLIKSALYNRRLTDIL